MAQARPSPSAGRRLAAGLFLSWMLVLWAVLALPFTLFAGLWIGLKRLTSVTLRLLRAPVHRTARR